MNLKKLFQPRSLAVVGGYWTDFVLQGNHKLGFKADLREYGIGAEILIACGVKKMKLLTNNPKKIVGLDGFGLKVTGREAIDFSSNDVNEKYLTTKRDKLGHLILGNNEK